MSPRRDENVLWSNADLDGTVRNMNEIETVGVEALGSLPTGAAGAKERPWLFGLLIAPMAVLSNGLAAGVLAYLFRQQGVSIERSGAILSLLVLPQTIYFLWSPLTDLFVRRRTWLMLGAMAAAAMYAIAFQEHSLAAPRAVALMFLGGCCAQLVVSSCGGMMGTLHSERSRLVASSFYQSGSLAFGAAAIFVLTMLAGRMPQAEMGWLAAGMIAVPALAAFGAPEQRQVGHEPLGATLRRMGTEFTTTFFCWRALPYALLMLFPMGSGAAIALLPGIAQDYGVNGAHVAWMNGVGGALLTAAGAMVATALPVRMRASVTYLICTLVNAGLLTVLWLGALRPETYYVGAALYLFSIGTCYAMTTAVILEFMGKSGSSGSGRYSIINSMANVPVAYMTALDGMGGKWWGPRGLPGIDVVMSAGAATVLLAWFLTHRQTGAGITAVEEAGLS